MKKRLISILLAVSMILCLIPFGVMAADDDTASNVNPVTGRVQGPEGDVDVAVMVYGDVITNYLNDHSGSTIDQLVSAASDYAQHLAGGVDAPKVEMYLVNPNTNEEYKLTEQSVKKAAFLSSFTYEAEGILGFSETVFNWISNLIGWWFEDEDELESLYRIYSAPKVPEGDYQLEIRNVEEDGYTLWSPESGVTNVTVKNNDKSVCYVGAEYPLGQLEIKHTVDLIIWEFEVEWITAKFYMPGVFLQTKDPGIEFKSADLGDNAVPGTEFVMVNRDETEKLIKAFYGLGKGTFENAIELYGTEGFTWEELSILRNDVLKWDSENAQISIDGQKAYKLLGTYWALLQAASEDPLLEFIRDDTELRIPAILSATADENGIVHFGPENNVTLIWSMEILQKMGGVMFSKIEEYELIDEIFPDPTTNAIVKFIIDIGKNYLGSDNILWDAEGNLKEDFINNWLYPILQNDNIMEYAQKTLKTLGSDLTEEEKEFLNLFPDHAFLTKKMPTGKYILFETSVPEGYFRSPFFYTVDLEWHPEAKYARDWYYGSIADIGILAPYFAEDFYDWLRDYDYKVEADKVLNYITDGKTGDLIAKTLTGQNDLTEYTITYFSNILYNYLGGDVIYSSEMDLAKSLTKYLAAYGRTAQNLLVFGDNLITRSKATVTGTMDKDWIFYNYSTSLRTNSALKTQKILKGVADAIDTTDDNPVTSGVKSVVQKIADKIDTTNRIKDQVTKIQNSISSFFSDIGSKIGSKLLDGVFSALKTVLSWSRAE